jgi:Zn-finger nucleic acid-binding protein
VGRRAEGGREPECPKCQGRLHEHALKATAVRVDCCPTCRGMWFESGELQEHLDNVEGKFVPPPATRVSERRCPGCGVNMTAFEYSGTDVEIDLCENCRGVWLDVGELKRLATGDEGARSKGGFLWLVGGAISELKFW